MGWIKSLFDRNIVTANEETSNAHPLIQADHPLVKAIGDKHEVTMLYRGVNDHPDDELSPRTVIPTEINEKGHVVAFDTGKKEWRTFVPARAQKIISTAPASISHEDLPPLPEEKAPGKSWKAISDVDRPAPTATSITPFNYIADDATPWDSVRGEKPQSSMVEPTEDEYEELKRLDIDPNTFDRATVKRLRNMGVTHAELKDALTNQVKLPLEDYETARINNPGSHLAAKQEAEGYQDTYRAIINERSEMLTKGHADYAGKSLLTQQDHDDLVEQLFGHHLTLKNLPTEEFASINPKSFTRYHSDAIIPWRRRASEWVTSECAKLTPSLRRYLNSSDDDYSEPFTNHYDPSEMLKTTDYSKIATSLHQHYNVIGLNARDIKSYIIANRKQKALANITSSQYLPYDYSYDQYEEEPRK
jgi:hypothetical protein